MKHYFTIFFSIILLLSPNITWANEVEIVDVVVKKTSENTFRFSVALKHDDEGWDHYANEWQILSPDGTLLDTRILAHPHVNEQPFARSLEDVYVPRNTLQVIIRAKDNVHGWAKTTLMTDIPH